jgi:drug/metabolite transporter (DMT)-like permease
VIGICGTTGHLLFVHAYKLADISLVEPAMFTRMIWAAIIGYVVFLEFPEFWTWIGAGVIVIGTTLLARRESRSEPPVVNMVSSTVSPNRGD